MSIDDLTIHALLVSNSLRTQGFAATAEALFVLADSGFFEANHAQHFMNHSPRLIETAGEASEQGQDDDRIYTLYNAICR
jgi:hypothetical protein